MSKDKWVRRFSVNETARHKNGFTIYKITSVLFPMECPEAASVVAVWKRYSEVRDLHTRMRALHAGLHLRGTFPPLPDATYFKRFQQEVIEERAKVIKTILEFIAEHQLLFTSTDFVNFLQSGYPEPEATSGGVINAIRSSLQLPIEEPSPLEYHSDDDSRSPQHRAGPVAIDEPDFISQIPVYDAVEDADSAARRAAALSHADSFESIDSLDSIGSDFYSDLEKVKIGKHESLVKKNVLPDLINFDVPSTSRFDDYHTMNYRSDSISLSSSANQRSEPNLSANHRSELDLSTNQRDFRDYSRSNSRVSNKSMLSLSNVPSVDCKTKTEDSYVFEAGYMLNLAARYEDMKEYSRAFECYKAGIEKMLIGVQSDSDRQRRALIKQKTNKYLSYAEAIYKNHLCDADQSLLEEGAECARALNCAPPLCALRRPYEELALYRLIAVLGSSMMLVLHRGEQTCYAMKVIQKIPNNLTEFDEYFLQNTNETRQPILPTVVPYMVPLHAYIETNNLIFLILSYAPGQQLFEYINNYIKSVPNTPAREVNLENVFTEPKIKKTDIENENLDSIIEIKTESKDSDISIVNKIELNDCSNNNETDFDNLDTKELVKNSQNLLKNVDKALSEVSVTTDAVDAEDVRLEIGEDDGREILNTEKIERITTPLSHRVSPSAAEGAGRALPAGAVSAWGAQILTALESLHNLGVICRDLNPSNILLGDQGQIILTYFVSYPGLEMALAKLKPAEGGEVNMYIAPELYHHTYLDDSDPALDRVCDFWSFGAIMYELLCAVPLSYYHRSVFTSHSVLQLPAGLPLDARSLLTQLLTYSPAERLGAGAGGIDDIKQHPYFRHIDWLHVHNSWRLPA